MSRLYTPDDFPQMFPAGIPAHKTVIMVHCLATRRSWAINKTAVQMVAEVRGWHVDGNGWNDIAYAAILDENGDAALGRDLDNDGNVWEETGAGAKGHNKGVIHIALSGGFGSAENDRPEDHFTAAQLAALRALIETIQTVAGRPLWVRGHNEVAAKACPGFRVGPWWENRHPRSLAGSKTLQATGVTGGAAISGAAGLFPQLDPTAQIMLIVILAIVLGGLAYIARERIRKWARGVR